MYKNIIYNDRILIIQYKIFAIWKIYIIFDKT